jgi:hypothetical protein
MPNTGTAHGFLNYCTTYIGKLYVLHILIARLPVIKTWESSFIKEARYEMDGQASISGKKYEFLLHHMKSESEDTFLLNG